MLKRLATLQDGQPFAFQLEPERIYVARGGCWYGSVGGYDGGPWMADGETLVVAYDGRIDVAAARECKECGSGGEA